MDKKVDILIIGGGLIGATLMIALKSVGLSTLLVESKSLDSNPDQDFDARSLALSPSSQRILNALDIWKLIKEEATAIESIHVSNKNHFGQTKLQAKDAPLGYVVEMQHLSKVLYQLQNKDNILSPASLSSLKLENTCAVVMHKKKEVNIQAKLIIAADGADSLVRQSCQLSAQTKVYPQEALVANVGLLKAHNNCAFERFTSRGLMALLPLKDKRMALVWTLPVEEAKLRLQQDDGQFLKDLQLAFGYRIGRFIRIGKRSIYPLKQVIMPAQNHWPFVFIGNAAHSLHPIAGQGFNLGLRDVATLAQSIAQFGLNKKMLQQYLHARRKDQLVISCLTDGLISIFNSKLPGMTVMRNIGLMAFQEMPILKNLLLRYMKGFGGVVPNLACELALKPRDFDENAL